jgi:hypothetical protein
MKIRDGVAVADVPVVPVLKIGAEQLDRIGMIAESSYSSFQLLVCAFDPRDPEEGTAGDIGDLIKIELSDRRSDLLVPEIGDRLASGDHAEAWTALPQLEKEHLQARVLQFATVKRVPGLERLEAIQQKKAPPPLDQLGQALPTIPRRKVFASATVAEPPKSLGYKLVGRGYTLLRPLAVERPGKHSLRAAVVILGEGLGPAAYEGGLADAT